MRIDTTNLPTLNLTLTVSAILSLSLTLTLTLIQKELKDLSKSELEALYESVKDAAMGTNAMRCINAQKAMEMAEVTEVLDSTVMRKAVMERDEAESEVQLTCAN